METQGQAPAAPGGEVEAFAAILARESGEELPNAQAEQPEQSEQPEQPEEVSTQDENQESQEDTITIDPEAPMFEVTIKAEGGANETKKVSLKELESGYMMQADYVRKTKELAKARDELQSEVSKMIEPERQQYVQNLQTLHQAVLSLAAPDLQQVNWEQLASEDPAKYVQLSARAQRVQQTMQHIQMQMQQAQQQAFQQAAEYSRRMLSDPINGIPNWGKEMYETLITEGSKAYGFTPEEIAQVVDYRMIKVLRDAHEYRKLMQAKPSVEKKVSVAPKVLKPGATADKGDLQARQEKELRQTLKKTGDWKDAANVFLAMDKRKR